MPDEPKTPKQELVQPTYARHPGPIGYVDFASVNSGYYGFKLSFATAIHTSPEPLLEEFASVGMSSEQAKDLHRVLGDQLRQFEERWGPIRPKVKELRVDGGATGKLERDEGEAK